MQELRRSSEVTPEDVKDVNIDVTAEIQRVEQKAREREEERGLLAGSRCPLLGHLVQIAQVRQSSNVVISLHHYWHLPKLIGLKINLYSSIRSHSIDS